MQDSIQFIAANPSMIESAAAYVAGLSMGVQMIIGAGVLAVVCRAI